MSCYHHLCMEERENLMLFFEQGKSTRQIANDLKRAPSTISRELRRNAEPYLAGAAQKRYKANRQHGIRRTILSDRELHKLVYFLFRYF